MERYLSVFDVSTIKFLLADREFIGAQWLDFLHKNNVPFIIRIKANQLVTIQGGKTQNLSTLLRFAAKLNFDARFGGNNLGEATWFSFAAKCIRRGELLIVASNRPAHRALTTYKKKSGH
jgi:hypothetical protein